MFRMEIMKIKVLMKSSLIIHRKVTCYHFGAKQGQRMMKFSMVTNFGLKNPTLTFILELNKSGGSR